MDSGDMHSWLNRKPSMQARMLHLERKVAQMSVSFEQVIIKTNTLVSVLNDVKKMLEEADD